MYVHETQHVDCAREYYLRAGAWRFHISISECGYENVTLESIMNK